MEFALYSGAAPRPEVLLHTRDRDAAGRRVDIILFGSLDNTGYRPGDAQGPGHTPSSWWAVRKLLASRGHEHGWGDDEEMAMEARIPAKVDEKTGADEVANRGRGPTRPTVRQRVAPGLR